MSYIILICVNKRFEKVLELCAGAPMPGRILRCVIPELPAERVEAHSRTLMSSVFVGWPCCSLVAC